MKAPVKLLLLIVGMILLACLLAPPLYHLGEWFAASAKVKFLQDMTFQRYFNRAFLLAALILIWPARIWLNISSWSELGLRKNKHAWTDLAIGFFAAFILLLAMGQLAVLCNVYALQGEIKWKKFSSATGTAITVSLLEEWLFRGIFLGLCLRVLKPANAILYISALFSILHFLKPIEEGLEINQVGWHTGFAMLPHIFHGFVEPLLLLSGFSTLFAIGVVLALTRVKTASLWMPIGLHAGWIYGQRAFNIVYKQAKEIEPNWLPWIFGERIEIGIAPLITVILTGALVLWVVRGRKVDPPATAI